MGVPSSYGTRLNSPCKEGCTATSLETLGWHQNLLLLPYYEQAIHSYEAVPP